MFTKSKAIVATLCAVTAVSVIAVANHASAHTPALNVDCNGISWSGVNYPAGDFATLTVNGSTQTQTVGASHTFSLSASFPGVGSSTFSYSVDSVDNEFDASGSGTQLGCQGDTTTTSTTEVTTSTTSTTTPNETTTSTSTLPSTTTTSTSPETTTSSSVAATTSTSSPPSTTSTTTVPTASTTSSTLPAVSSTTVTPVDECAVFNPNDAELAARCGWALSRTL